MELWRLIEPVLNVLAMVLGGAITLWFWGALVYGVGAGLVERWRTWKPGVALDLAIWVMPMPGLVLIIGGATVPGVLCLAWTFLACACLWGRGGPPLPTLEELALIDGHALDPDGRCTRRGCRYAKADFIGRPLGDSRMGCATSWRSAATFSFSARNSGTRRRSSA